MRKFRGEMPPTTPGVQTLCEPAQPKCTWAFHKSNCVRKFPRKMRRWTSWSTLIEHRLLNLPQKNLQFGHAVWGIEQFIFLFFQSSCKVSFFVCFWFQNVRCWLFDSVNQPFISSLGRPWTVEPHADNDFETRARSMAMKMQGANVVFFFRGPACYTPSSKNIMRHGHGSQYSVVRRELKPFGVKATLRTSWPFDNKGVCRVWVWI